MRKEGKIQGVLIVFLVLTIVGLSVGFAAAAFNQTLQITGSVTAKKASWDIHFTNFVEKSGVGYVSSSNSLNTSNTTLSYTVTLEPTEKYEFTVDAKNFGTFDAKLVGITLDGALTTAEQKYLTYTVTVDGVAYTSSTTGLSEALASGASHTVKVSLAYNLPANASDLPTTDVTKSFTISLDYESVIEK